MKNYFSGKRRPPRIPQTLSDRTRAMAHPRFRTFTRLSPSCLLRNCHGQASAGSHLFVSATRSSSSESTSGMLIAFGLFGSRVAGASGFVIFKMS